MFASACFRKIKVWVACHSVLYLGGFCLWEPFPATERREGTEKGNKQLTLPFHSSRILRNICSISNTEYYRLGEKKPKPGFPSFCLFFLPLK